MHKMSLYRKQLPPNPLGFGGYIMAFGFGIMARKGKEVRRRNNDFRMPEWVVYAVCSLPVMCCFLSGAYPGKLSAYSSFQQAWNTLVSTQTGILII